MRRPPSTAWSASTECGGAGASTSATEPESRALAEPAIGCPGLLFGDDRYRQRHVHVGVQVQTDHVLAQHAQRATRQAHFAALDLEARLVAGLGDVGGTDRAEELA